MSLVNLLTWVSHTGEIMKRCFISLHARGIQIQPVCFQSLLEALPVGFCGDNDHVSIWVMKAAWLIK